MRIIYFLYLDIQKHGGVAKKVLDAMQVWETNGCTVSLVCLTPTVPQTHAFTNNKNVIIFKDRRLLGLPMHFFDWIFLSSEKKQILKFLEEFKPDIFHLRYYPYTPFLSRIAKKYRVVYEINTVEKKEYWLQAKVSYKYKLYYLFYILTYKGFFKNVKAVISVTKEILEQSNIPIGVKTLISPNSISLSRVNTLPRIPSNKNVPVLVFIGSANMPWHGVDILLEIATKTVGKLFFEIIGMQLDNVPENVRTHGYLSQNEYKQILQSADIGVSSLALFRNEMNEACPLKTREYLAFGFPIIVAYNDTAFGDATPPWVLALPNSHQGILDSVDKIVAFANSQKGRVISKDEVRPYIDADIIEAKKVAFMRSLV